MSAETRWPVPPAEGYHFEDLFTLPDLPPHTELLDGGLVFVAPQTNYHQLLVTLLETRLREAARGASGATGDDGAVLRSHRPGARCGRGSG